MPYFSSIHASQCKASSCWRLAYGHGDLFSDLTGLCIHYSLTIPLIYYFSFSSLSPSNFSKALSLSLSLSLSYIHPSASASPPPRFLSLFMSIYKQFVTHTVAAQLLHFFSNERTHPAFLLVDASLLAAPPDRINTTAFKRPKTIDPLSSSLSYY